MSSSTPTLNPDQHTAIKSLLLHIAPGVLVTGSFLLFKPLVDSTGYPPLLAFLLAVLLVDLPVMLAVMLYEGKLLNGRFSLEGVVLYRERVPWKSFALIFLGAFIALYIFIMLATPINGFLSDSLFSWLPDWSFLDERTQYEAYAKNILLVIFTLHLVLTGIVLPWVEELYFRGYLLPRLSRYGRWTPLISGGFFGLYHFWQLFGFVGVFLLGSGLGYVAWWKKDIRLSISLHVCANALVRLFLLLSVLVM